MEVKTNIDLALANAIVHTLWLNGLVTAKERDKIQEYSQINLK